MAFSFILFIERKCYFKTKAKVIKTKKTEQSPVSKKDDTIRRSKSPRKTE